jgi:hypothetical protein
MDFANIINGSENAWVFFAVVLWTLPWKGVALWKAAHNKHKKWFIAILILNTLAIVEILYIFFFSKKKPFDSAQGRKAAANKTHENN